MKSKAILVTGGAGYIGSHVVRQLGENGENIVVLDNLSTGFRSAVLHGELILGDIGDPELVARILKQYDIDTIMHFAAHTIVPESVENPFKYYRNNNSSSLNLLECAAAAGVRHFIFSSTAAVYGIPNGGIASEDSDTLPINPYGTSKLVTEWMLRDVAAVSPMSYTTLRYFNVAGSDPGCRIGQSTEKATLLIKVACEAAVGKRTQVTIYGTDYGTPDGTGIRDYIHVEDLATAHLRALDYLRQGGTSIVLNCGYGHGYSVREVLAAVEKAAGEPLNIRKEGRRPGDPDVLIAATDRIRDVFDWTPEYDDLDLIVNSSLAWEKKLLSQPVD
jgi:UDP-glucose 4-epimerase